MRVTVQDDPGQLVVTVTDAGPAAGPAPADLADRFEDASTDGGSGPQDLVDPDVALAVVHGLVDDVSVEAGPDGTAVTMRWPLQVSA